MSDARDPSDHGGPNDPEFRVGRGKPARRRIAALIIGIVLFVFAVLLTIWLLGRSAADAQSAAPRLAACPPTLLAISVVTSWSDRAATDR